MTLTHDDRTILGIIGPPIPVQCAGYSGGGGPARDGRPSYSYTTTRQGIRYTLNGGPQQVLPWSRIDRHLQACPDLTSTLYAATAAEFAERTRYYAAMDAINPRWYSGATDEQRQRLDDTRQHHYRQSQHLRAAEIAAYDALLAQTDLFDDAGE